MSVRLSVAIICKDNARTIGEVARRAAELADEVVAVDSGSSDGTQRILREIGVRVIDSPWLGFARTKQLALDSCAGEWVLNIDSDEYIEPDLARAIDAALARDEPEIVGFQINRKVWFRGRLLHHAWQPDWTLRLVRRGRARWKDVAVHEELLAQPGRIERLGGVLRHDTITSYGAFIEKQRRYGELSAQMLRQRGRRASVLRLVFSPLGAFIKQLVLKRGFLDGWRGVAASVLVAHAAWCKHRAMFRASSAENPVPGRRA